MSFFINNTEPSEAYFNGSEVSTIYYNGTLIWKVVKFEWGDETAIGDSAWWLALKEWIASASAAERQACIGKTKKVSLSTAVLGASAYTMRCIGADEDGEGTLTFESVNTSPSNAVINGSSSGTNAWIGSTVRSRCQSFYNYCSAKSAIKTVKKGTYPPNKTTAVYNNETVFVLSRIEMGLSTGTSTTNSECTYGYNAAYSYYADNVKTERIKYKSNASGNATTTKSSYWLRTPYYSSDVYYIKTDGGATWAYRESELGVAPAFVIG